MYSFGKNLCLKIDPEPYDFRFRLVVSGYHRVGKTSLIKQFTQSSFNINEDYTIGVEFDKSFLSIDNFRVQLQLWELAGGEKFRPIIHSYYRGSEGVILVYDITNRNSFNFLGAEIEQVGGKPTLIVGTKADLEEKREVSYEEAKEFGKKVGIQVIEASAKENMNIEDIFFTISRQIAIKLDIKNLLSPLVDQPKPAKVEEEPPKNPDYDEKCKIIMVGDSGVGKSNMLQRLCKGTFNTDHVPTSDADFDTKIIMYHGKRIQLQIWATAGKSEYREVIQTHYQEGDMIMFVYDISNRDSFESLDFWIQEVTNHNGDGALKVVIGNKNDMEEERKVSYEEGKTYAEKVEGFFFEVSAINGETFENNFLQAFSEILDSLGIEVQ